MVEEYTYHIPGCLFLLVALQVKLNKKNQYSNFVRCLKFGSRPAL